MKVAIIGGGAAGLMAAATIHEQDPSIEVVLLERNDGLGKKVIISGGGRCNVTTGFRDVKTVLTKYPRGGKFLSSVMYGFPPAAVYDWFEAHGVPLKTQDDMRVFPQSDDGKDVVRAFERIFAARQFRIMLKTHVVRIEKREDGFAIFTKGTGGVSEDFLLVNKVVLTTGGQAYRATGSTGDGYAFAMSLGHSITKLAASLNSFTTYERWPADISGLSFEEARISADCAGEPEFTGPFLFTHKGVSGPAVFALSSLVAFERYDGGTPLKITIDLFPNQTVEKFTDTILAHIAENPKKNLVNVIGFLVPKSLADICRGELELPGEKRANEVSRKDIVRIATWLKGIPLRVIGRGAGDEFVTAGGVNLKEVDPSTMESRICPGLYFAGEILDVDGYTGGFNLQASWAAGHRVGESIAQAE